MLPRRILPYINVGIGALLVLVLIAGYWFVWRPLPETSGTLTAPISARASVVRDSLGVPHVSASSLEDALFLQGFVTAQDRLFQMDAMRRQASGELAEVAGPVTLEADRESRLLRLPRLAEEHSNHLTPEDRRAFVAYARGVNYFLETNRGRLPLEFTLLSYDPRPWRVADSLAIALQMFNTLTRSWTGDKRKSDMLAGGDPAKVNALFPVRAGGTVLPGSNAWAVSGARTATGKPLLASDPHVEFSLPAAWYMVHLKAPGLDVSGVSLPGLPGVLIGHNTRIAWGITNLQYDVQDLYIERMDTESGHYLFRGKPEQARPEREIIRVKGAKQVEVVVWVTRHGPVVATDGGRWFALRWVAAELDGFQYPFLDLNRAPGWAAFRAALARFPGPGSNFVYADAEGNIGYQAAGRLPIRKGFQGDQPVDGSSGNFEWDGFIPFEQLPSVYNPPAGIIVSANQNPFPENYPYGVSGFFSGPYRARQIRARLEARGGWRPQDMLALQSDVYSALSHSLALEAAAAYERRGVSESALGAAVSLLKSWNGQMTTGSPAPMIAALLYQHLETALAERASPGKGLVYRFEMAPAAVEEVLRARPKGWFEDYDQLLLRSLADALDEGRRMQGQDIAKWDYGRFNQLFLANPVAGRLPVVGKYFNIGPVAMSGWRTTVKQITRGLGPSMRMVVDFSDLDRSLQNITIGQSGQALSRHYRDQWEAYYQGRSFPMQFNRVDAKDVLAVVPQAK